MKNKQYYYISPFDFFYPNDKLRIKFSKSSFGYEGTESDDFEKVLDLVEKQAFRLVSAWTRATE